MPKKITRDQIEKIAKLARLEISEEKSQSLENDLEEILEYVAQLSEISTVGVKPAFQVNNMSNVFRDDIRKESLPLADLEKIAPDFGAGGFRVPKVI